MKKLDPHKTFHSATWWKGKVTVAVTKNVEVIVKGRAETLVKVRTISPMEDKLVRYNPFDFYFPFQKSMQRRGTSLHHRFVAVNKHDVKEVQSFCEEFGVFGNPKKTWEEWNATGTSEYWPYQGKSDDSLSNRMATKSRTPPHPSLCIPMSLQEFQLEQSAMKIALNYIQKRERERERERERVV